MPRDEPIHIQINMKRPPMARYSFVDAPISMRDDGGRSGRDPSEHLGNMGIAYSSGRNNGGNDEKDEYTNDTVAGQCECLPPHNLSRQAGRSGVDPTLPDTDSVSTYKPRDADGDDYPPLKSPGNSLRVGKPSDSHEIVDTFPNPSGGKYSYYAGEPRPGEWRLFRSQPSKSGSDELVKSYPTKGGRLFYQIQRNRDEVNILCTDRQLLDPGWRSGMGEMPKSPATADRHHAEAREEHTKDSIRSINQAHKRFYAPGHRR